ncbi:MAG: SycD/LcrH family type III secretion system chaperone [Candidatus Methylacidiphilales bacterium]|nr:SycD/LcrH family type III secretion system chaperone [Candidatus Methylacidiphilales bacterium]
MSTSTPASSTLPDNEESVKALTDLLDGFLKNSATLKDVRGLTNENMEAVYSVGYSLYTNGKFEDSEKIFQFLCLFDHLERKYWLGLGGSRQMLKQYDRAVEAYAYAALLDISDPTAASRAADCHIALGKLTEAESSLTAAVEFSRGKPEHEKIFERSSALLELVQKKLGEAAPATAETAS